MSGTDGIEIRVEGRAGRITLQRPEALNALTWEMCLAIDAALIAWEADEAVDLLVIDGAGERAFCAGGDIAQMYHSGRAGDFDYGRRFWADEYRMNARLFEFPKPVVAFLHGFTMGGGVGVGCHASHRVVCEDSKIALPEVGIGLVPDVGATLLLGRAPGRLGEYLGVTGTRMGPGDAIHAEFADYFIPRGDWPGVIAALCDSGDPEVVDRAAGPRPESPLAALQPQIDHGFAGETLRDILNLLRHTDSDFAREALETIARGAPLAMAATVELVHRTRARDDIRHALGMEYRYTARAMEQGDFLEGIRAAIIDKDKAPRWRHDGPEAAPAVEVAAMLMPLGAGALTF